MADPEILVNDSDTPRFTAAGRYVEPGATFPASEMDAKTFVAKNAPVGTLTDEQLLAAVAARGLTPNPGAPASEPAAAPVSPGPSQETLDRLDEVRAEQLKDVVDAGRASERAAEINEAQAKALDRDGDGAAGGSRTKAEIAADLTELGVEFDGRKSRDELEALLNAELAK